MSIRVLGGSNAGDRFAADEFTRWLVMVSIEGRVLDATSRIVPAILVQAERADGTLVAHTQTDQLGYFRFEVESEVSPLNWSNLGIQLYVGFDSSQLAIPVVAEAVSYSDHAIRVDLTYVGDEFPLRAQWGNPNPIAVSQMEYVCAHCGVLVAPSLGYQNNNYSELRVSIFLCPRCNQPTYFNHRGQQFPSPSFGEDVPSINDEHVVKLYREARDCMSIGAYTAAVLTCRKLLLDVADHARTRKLERLRKEGKDTRSVEDPLARIIHRVTDRHLSARSSGA